MGPLLLSLVILSLVAPPRVQATPPPPAGPAMGAIRVADSLLAAGRFGPCLAIADSLARLSSRTGDRALRSRALTLVAAVRTLTGQPDRGEVAAREAMEIGFADRDSTIARRALRWLAYTHLQRGRFAVSTPLYQHLLELSSPAAEWDNVGYAHMGIAYAALMAGRLPEARRGYERALVAMRRSGDAHAVRLVSVGLARVLAALGEFDATRALYRELLDSAIRTGDWMTEAQALNNLGALEFTVGDPALALTCWRRALALHPGSSQPTAYAVERTNIALALATLGRSDEAAAGLDSLVDACAAAGLQVEEAETRARLAEVRRDQGRRAEAWNALAPTLAVLDSLPQASREWVVMDASVTLRGLGRIATADSMLRRELQRPGLTALARASMEGGLATAALALGQVREALEHARSAERIAARLGDRGVRMQALAAASGAWRALGFPDSARAGLETAAELWDAERSAPSDPEWREHRGRNGVEVFATLARLILDTGGNRPGAAREAFDVVQRYKARTLLERMSGPGRDVTAGVRPPARADEVMRALRPGEVLLDYFDGRDSAVVFAVDRSGVSVARLASGPRLWERARVLRDLSADRRGGPLRESVRRRAETALGEVLFGGVAARVRAADAVILAPDGVVGLVPLESLVLPGDGHELRDGRVVWRVPSATMLVSLRARPADTRGHGVLALAGTRDSEGRRLVGAEREVRGLGARFEDVEVRMLSGRDAVAVALGALSRCEVLHIAAHTALDDRRPWNSGVFLGGGGASEWLRAGAIAGTRMSARLAVLAGCATGGGRALSGEGAQGLSAAFLSAGVPAVVVTLWPVDDRAAERFSDAFYGRLAHGQTAAAALAGAQADLSRRPEMRVADWAGFVLVGDGTTRVRLAERPRPWWVLAFALALIAALVTVSRAFRARRRARTVGL